MTTSDMPAPAENGDAQTAHPLAGVALTKRFGQVLAVHDVTLHVARAEVVALIGPNGAGKSTLLSLLAGLLTPDSGMATIDGMPSLTTGGLARQNLGFVAGDTKLYQKLTVKETLEFYGALNGLSSSVLQARIEAVSHELNIDALKGRRCESLSSGQEQRVNLARALLHDPSILILDEPTNALDVASQNFVLEFVEASKRNGRAVLFASHVMGEVERVADRVIVLADGCVKAEGTLDVVVKQGGAAGLRGYFTEVSS